MLESACCPPCSSHQLEELLRDPEIVKIVDLTAKEVMRHWCIPFLAARGFVISAIGEPQTIGELHAAWTGARRTGTGLGLTKVIVRRRVIDLLRRDARHPSHCSLPAVEDHDEAPRDTLDDHVRRTPQAEIELRQLIHLVRDAVACFATQGSAQRRQAELLRRYAFEEASYTELSVELGCTEGALRVRVHKAMVALRRHIHVCHVELEHLIERPS